MNKNIPKSLSLLLLLTHFSLIYGYTSNWGQRYPSKIKPMQSMTCEEKQEVFIVLEPKCKMHNQVTEGEKIKLTGKE